MKHINREKLNEVQGFLFGVLQILIHKLESTIANCGDTIMTIVLQLLNSPEDNNVHEECLLTVSALANAINEQFSKYVSAFYPSLKAGLSNWEDFSVCHVAVNLVGDLCRALGTGIAQYCDEIIQLFLHNLSNPDLDKSVKPPTLSAIGDIALALVTEPCELKFSKYLPYVMPMLEQASSTVIEPDIKPDDYELIDYVQLLKVGVIEAYIGICQSLNDSEEFDVIKQYAQPIVNLLEHFTKDRKCPDDIVRLTVGLCGDFVQIYGEDIQTILPRLVYDWIDYVSKKGETEQTRETAKWTADRLYS
jgi:importin subunit beta-1